MAIKITSLTESKATAANDVMVLDDGTTTKKINAKTFQKEVSDPLNTAISEAVATEKSARESADSTLQTNINNETSARTSADSTLQTNIDSEVSARKSGDTTLTNNLNAEITRAKAEEAKKVNTSDIVNNLNSTDTDKPLSAYMGKRLKDLIDSKNFSVVGFKRERANSNYSTRIEYTDDAVGYTPVTVDLANQTQDLGSWSSLINNIARPVMLKSDGTVDYELNHDDTTKKLDGSNSDISNTDYDGNAMVEFRNYRWVSRKTVDGYDYVRFANYKVDDTFEDNAFRDINGDVSDAFYWSMFEGSLISNKLRSLADQEIMRSKNASTEMTYAKANGDGWLTIAWTQLNYIWDLLTLLGKSDGLQETYGRGICDLSWNDGVNPFGWIVGQTKDKGCFFGQSGGANPVRTLWIEDLWGRAWDRCAGMVLIDNVYKVKTTAPYPTPTDTASTYDEYTNTEISAPTAGYTKEANCDENGFLPTTIGGSASTYFCDYFYVNASGVRYVIVGGRWNDGSFCGRYVDVSFAASFADTYIGSRLLKI